MPALVCGDGSRWMTKAVVTSLGRKGRGQMERAKIMQGAMTISVEQPLSVHLTAIYAGNLQCCCHARKGLGAAHLMSRAQLLWQLLGQLLGEAGNALEAQPMLLRGGLHQSGQGRIGVGSCQKLLHLVHRLIQAPTSDVNICGIPCRQWHYEIWEYCQSTGRVQA